MISVKNRKIVFKLALKNFYSNKIRNVIAVFAIALTTILFTSLFTMGFGMMKSMQLADMIMSGGDGQARVSYMTKSQYDILSNHFLIKEIAYCRKLADSVDNDSLIKRHTQFWYYDDVGLKYAFVEPTSGHKPQAKNEIITDTTTLKMLGIPQKLGAKLKLRSEEHTSELQSRQYLVCRLLLEKKKK